MPDDEVAHDAGVDDAVDELVAIDAIDAVTPSDEDRLPEDVDDPVAADHAPGPGDDDLLPEDVDTDEWPGDDLLPEDTAPVPPSGPRRRSSGSVLGAAMMGLQQALYGKPHEETVIEVETSGDPPVDEIKARRGPGRPSRSSRSSRRHR